MKKMVYLGVLFALSVLFQGCENPVESAAFTESSIVGTWACPDENNSVKEIFVLSPNGIAKIYDLTGGIALYNHHEITSDRPTQWELDAAGLYVYEPSTQILWVEGWGLMEYAKFIKVNKNEAQVESDYVKDGTYYRILNTINGLE